MALLHSDLKEMGITSIGHRLTILKAVYDLKLKQHLPIEPDDYVPLCEQHASPSQLCKKTNPSKPPKQRRSTQHQPKTTSPA
jgi:hypothetical protein